MIEVTHYPDLGGWGFASKTVPGLLGGGRSFEKSAEAAEHAYRQYVSDVRGYAVSLGEARELMRHLEESPAHVAA